MVFTTLIMIITITAQGATVAPIEVSALPDPGAIMKLDSFKRADWCHKLLLKEDEKAIRARLFTSILTTNLETARNFLETKGIKLPSPSGYFHPPRAQITISEVRRGTKEIPSVINILLGAPSFEDPKGKTIGDLVIRGCMLSALSRMKPPFLAKVLHEAAFNPYTLIFRSEITKILQKSGPEINLYFVPWAERNYNRERHPLPFYMSRYAIYILNSSVAGNPRIALQSAPIDLKFRLMELYSKHHEASAIEPMLQLCNSEDPVLRKEARKYMIRYFEGPGTKSRVGTIKLPGGIEKTAVLYLGARQQAYHAVKKTLEEVTHGDYDRTTSSKKLAKQLFKAWDNLRDARWDILFTQAYQRYREGAIDEAVGMYRKVLANNPNKRQKELMFPAFMALARKALMARKMLDAMRFIRILSQIAASPSLEADLYYLLG
ncbi:hypothetical protein KKF84_04260, partial [Myxococcota bacterium]|nr:hypothetical protein [Myxococcota bacterium]